MSVRIVHADLHLKNLRTRMPFKYGIATMTHMPMVFVRVQAEIDGVPATGISADLLPPKWFTKNPNRGVREEIWEMFHVVQHAADQSVGYEAASTFELWKELYDERARQAADEGIPPLLQHFGTSLVERALIEADCRARGMTFAAAVQANALGIDLGALHAELAGTSPADFLQTPLASFLARHTVGLADPLRAEDVPAEARLDDGLPQALTECISRYGLRHFKLKINGQLDTDLERLNQLATIFAEHAPADYAYSLDGNEQFKRFADFRTFWDAFEADERLADFRQHLLFVEQPLHRDVALDAEVKEDLDAWPGHPPVIIDESDSRIESLPTALKLGYAGTSHKNCKGVFKGLANRCLLLHRAQQDPDAHWVMSGEDLCNIGPISLLQDLAVSAALGIESIERNGHHYGAGLSMFPDSVQTQIREHHGDLYHQGEKGWPTLNITDGRAALGSLNRAPFGVAFDLDVTQFTPAAEWEPEVVD